MKKPRRRDWNKRLRNVRLFAAVVRSPPSVRHAFDENRILALWWTCILSLHGSPMPKPLAQSDRCEVIAEGFTFYGLIYRFLAAMFFVSGFVVWIGAGDLF